MDIIAQDNFATFQLVKKKQIVKFKFSFITLCYTGGTKKKTMTLFKTNRII